MSKSTREEIRNRTAAPIVDKAAVSLEAEAERIKAQMEADIKTGERMQAEAEEADRLSESAPTPAQEIEREAEALSVIEQQIGKEAAKEALDALKADRSRWAALRDARQNIPQAPKQTPLPVVHTKEVALVVESAYKQFLGLGHGPETARSLANTYGILELAIVLNKIIGKV